MLLFWLAVVVVSLRLSLGGLAGAFFWSLGGIAGLTPFSPACKQIHPTDDLEYRV